MLENANIDYEWTNLNAVQGGGWIKNVKRLHACKRFLLIIKLKKHDICHVFLLIIYNLIKKRMKRSMESSLIY